MIFVLFLLFEPSLTTAEAFIIERNTSRKVQGKDNTKWKRPFDRQACYDVRDTIKAYCVNSEKEPVPLQH